MLMLHIFSEGAEGYHKNWQAYLDLAFISVMTPATTCTPSPMGPARGVTACGIQPAASPARLKAPKTGCVATAALSPSMKAKKVAWSMPQWWSSGAYARIKPRSRFLGRRWGMMTTCESWPGDALPRTESRVDEAAWAAEEAKFPGTRESILRMVSAVDLR